MNSNLDILKPYHQYILETKNLDDDTFIKLIAKIEEICCERVNLEDLIQKAEKNQLDGSYKEGDAFSKLKINKNNKENRVDYLLEACFLVNKVTKLLNNPEISIKDVDDNWPEDLIKMYKKLEDKQKKEKKLKFTKIYLGLNSNEPTIKNNAIKEFISFNEEDFKEYKDFSKFIENKEYFYKLKKNLIKEIIYEFRINPEKYKEYNYGFVEDETESDKVSCLFMVSLPNTYGTYQFHILRKEEKEIIYSQEDFYKVKYPFGKLGTGDTKCGRFNWIFGKEDFENLDKAEHEYEIAKRNLEEFNQEMNNEDITEVEINKKYENLKKLYMYGMLLGKDLYKEFNNLGENKYLTSQQKFTKGNGKSIQENINYEAIIENLRRNKKIYYSSKYSVDTKIAIESLLREAKKNNIIDKIELEEITPKNKSKIDKTGIYLNTNKNGFYNDKNPNGPIYINANEEINENSTCSVLKSLGIDVPNQIVKYASALTEKNFGDPNSLYILLSRLEGDKIFDLAKEIEKEGRDLIDEKVSNFDENKSSYEDNLDTFTSINEDDKKKLRIEAREKTKLFNKQKELIKYIDIGNDKIALSINEGGSEVVTMPYIAFNEGANYYIGINKFKSENKDEDSTNSDKEKIQFAILSNKTKGILPLEIKNWIYKKIYEIEGKKLKPKQEGLTYNNLLITNSRIILGGTQNNEKFLTIPKENNDETLELFAKEIIDVFQKSINQENSQCLVNEIINKSLSTTNTNNLEKKINNLDKNIKDKNTESR